MMLAAVNLPEDTRDLKAAAKQIFKGELPKYDYKNYQAPFSFFRGTAIEPIVNKMGKSGVGLHEIDVTLSDTKLGEVFEKKLKYTVVDSQETGRHVPKAVLDDSRKTIVKIFEVEAKNLKIKLLTALLKYQNPVLMLYQCYQELVWLEH